LLKAYTQKDSKVGQRAGLKAAELLSLFGYTRKKTNHGFMARGFRMGFNAMRDDMNILVFD